MTCFIKVSYNKINDVKTTNQLRKFLYLLHHVIKT